MHDVEASGGRGHSLTPGVAAGEVSAAEGGPATGTPARGGSGRRRFPPAWLTARRAGWALLVAGLLGAGCTGGWVLRGWLAEPALRVETPVIDRPIVVADAPDVEEGAPNVLGLSESDARQVFANLGIGGDDLGVEQVPAAGQAGLVVGQRPEPGAELDGSATLLVSVAATVPEVVGAQEADARAWLAGLGARVVVERVFHDTAAEGTVLAVEPAAGQPLVDTATLQIAGAPSSVFLAELEPVESACGTVDEAAVNGSPVGPSLQCQPYADEPTAAEYVLNRRVSYLEASVGIDDRTSAPTAALVRVLVDGAPVFEERIEFGAATPLRIAVTGALRLRIEVGPADPSGECCPERPDVIVGDARLVGGPDAIEALIAESNG